MPIRGHGRAAGCQRGGECGQEHLQSHEPRILTSESIAGSGCSSGTLACTLHLTQKLRNEVPRLLDEPFKELECGDGHTAPKTRGRRCRSLVLHMRSGRGGGTVTLTVWFGADALYTVSDSPAALATKSQSTSGDRISRRSLPALLRGHAVSARMCLRQARDGDGSDSNSVQAPGSKAAVARRRWRPPTGGVLEGHGNDLPGSLTAPAGCACAASP
jgi:hypothetical protein